MDSQSWIVISRGMNKYVNELSRRVVAKRVLWQLTLWTCRLDSGRVDSPLLNVRMQSSGANEFETEKVSSHCFTLTW